MIRENTFQQVRVTGPSNLIQTLTTLGVENQEFPYRLAAVINGERILTSLIWLDEHPDPITFQTDTYLVLMNMLPTDDFKSTEAVEAADLLGRMDAEGTYVLDRLIIGPTRWKSVICEDFKCCPHDGKPRNYVQTKSNQEQFDYLIKQTELQGKLDSIGLTALENIQVRDAWLVYITDPSESDRLKTWLNIFQETDSLKSPNQDGIELCRFLTLHSILFYLNNEIYKSRDLINQAEKFSTDYSITKLIQRAHQTSAPSLLIREAFQAVTYEKLNIFPKK
jgi:hypothetical protein